MYSKLKVNFDINYVSNFKKGLVEYLF